MSPNLPLMAENNPRVVFERLSGASDSTGTFTELCGLCSASA